MQYKQWLNEWFENYVKISSKARTVERYEQIIKRHLVPKLGEYDLNDLTPMILQKYIAELLRCGNIRTGEALSANSVNSIITIMQGSLKIAYSLNLLKVSITDKIIRPRLIEKQIECFSFEEQKQIESEVINSKKEYLIGIVICLYTGLRLGELLALEWSDIDFSKEFLMVRRSCHYGKKPDKTYGKIIDTPKTSTSTRIIPLPCKIVKILKDQNKKSHSKFVIANGSKEISVRTYQRNFEVLLKRLNIQHRGFHSLRHTFATRAMECGMDVKTLSEVLGHKSPMITLNRYAHSMFNHKKEMMNRVAKLL